MSKVAVLRTMVVGPNWLPRRLIFLFAGPLFNVSLSRYDFRLLIQDKTGDTIYEDPIGKADTNGRLDAGRCWINMRGGQLMLAGLREGKGGMLGVAIQGRSFYSRLVCGDTLMFKVEVQFVQAATTKEASSTLARSEEGQSLAVTSQFMPFDIGGSVEGTLTWLGDVRSNLAGSSQMTPVLVATELKVQQIAVPR